MYTQNKIMPEPCQTSQEISSDQYAAIDMFVVSPEIKSPTGDNIKSNIHHIYTIEEEYEMCHT